MSCSCAGWNYLSGGSSDSPPAPAAVAGPAAAYYQEPQDIVSAVLQLQGSAFLPLVQQSQQQTAAAIAQVVAQGVVPANVSVTLPQVRCCLLSSWWALCADGCATLCRAQGANSSQLACAISVVATASIPVLNALQTAASDGSLQGALVAQVSVRGWACPSLTLLHLTHVQRAGAQRVGCDAQWGSHHLAGAAGQQPGPSRHCHSTQLARQQLAIQAGHPALGGPDAAGGLCLHWRLSARCARSAVALAWWQQSCRVY